MKYLYSIIFLLVGCAASAQKIRFTDSSNRWAIKSYHLWNPFACDASVIRKFDGDSVVNGLHYQHLYDNAEALVREDTVQRIVYYRLCNQWSQSADTSDQVLYDYNWQIGDTTYRMNDQLYTEVITGLDSVMINSTWHKVWTSHIYSSQWYITQMYTIEGIGNVINPLFTLFPSLLDNCSALLCFYSGGQQPVMGNAVGYFDNNGSCLLSTYSMSGEDKDVAVVPNPVTMDSKIVFSFRIQSGSLVIYNGIGQCVAKVSIQGSSEYCIGDMIRVQGAYYFILTDEGTQTSYRGKFMY